MDDLWIDKYKPNYLKDVISNKTIVKNIDKYINSLKKEQEDKHIIMIRGKSGSGKSLISRLVLEKYNYRIIELNSTNLKSDLNTILYNSIHYKNVLESFMEDNRKTAIIIEELESMNFLGIKSNITDLIDLIKKSEKKNANNKDKIKIPIILTCNLCSEKKITILEKLCKTFILKDPTNLSIKKILDHIIISENITISDNLYNQILINSNKDIRKAITLLYDIHISFKNNINIDKNINLKTDSEIFIYNAINDIFFNTLSYELLENIYYAEPFLIPLIIHENYINIIFKNKKLIKDSKEIINLIINCSTYIINSDLFNSNIILNQYYDIQNYMPYLNTIPINVEFKKYKFKIDDNIRFSSLFNKLSQKTNKKQKVTNLLLNIKNPLIDPDDLNIFIKLCVYYIYDYKNLSYLNLLIKYYNLTYEQLEQIIKFEVKTNYNIKIKKEILSLFSSI